MRFRAACLLLITLLLSCLGGCADTGGVTFAKATGVITYKGAPVSGAHVVVLPENGPLAMGNTNDQGKFTLWTSDRNGVAVGKIRVTVVVAGESESDEITATAAPSSGADASTSTQGAMQSMMKFDEVQKKKGKKGAAKSPLLKYADAATSGLSYEIKPGTNELKIDLK